MNRAAGAAFPPHCQATLFRACSQVNPVDSVRETGLGCPRREFLLQASAHFFVCQKLTAIKLPQSLGDFLPEPCIVIDVAFHKLLHILVCAAPVGRRHAFKLRLHLWGELYFHVLQGMELRAGRQVPRPARKRAPARFPPNTAQRKNVSRLNGRGASADGRR